VAGQNAYLSFDRTVRLTEVMRQQGENDEAVLFRTALKLRSDILSETSWRLLCTRARNELSPDEVATFDSALRLYFTNNEVEFYNHGKLKSLKTPVKKVVGRHRGASASKATEEQADNLSAEIFLAVKARVILRKNLWVERGLVIENKEINSLNVTCCTRSRESDSSLHFSGPLLSIVGSLPHRSPQLPELRKNRCFLYSRGDRRSNAQICIRSIRIQIMRALAM
jgi:hypothetical protein